MQVLKPGVRVRNMSAAGDLEILIFEGSGAGMVNVVFRNPDGTLDQRLLGDEDVVRIEFPSGNRWTFAAAGNEFTSASEA